MDNQFNFYWEEILNMLSETFTSVSVETVIKPLEPLEIADGFFTVYAPEGYIKETVEHRYKKQIEKNLSVLSGLNYKLRLVTDKNDILTKNTESKKIIKQAASRSSLNSKYLFSNFVKGKSNELAYAASVAVSEKPGITMYNPLFIYGGVGLGKTHLMHSIGNFIIEQDPDKKIRYTSTENFTNEFVTSIRMDHNQAFRDKYRQIDVLLLDDIQFLSEKEGTQEELFHTFNTLYNSNKQIVITSDQPPKDLKNIEERLTSRFGNGLIVDISIPDFETRIAILEKKAELEGTFIPSEVTHFIARSIVSNIRDLEGVLIKVIAMSRLGSGSPSKINLPMTERILKDFISGNDKKEITIDFIIETTASYFNVSTDEMKGKRRTQNIVHPRHIAMYFCRKFANVQSLPMIGHAFGGRDHTTVINACNKIAAELENDFQLKEMMLELEKLITGN
ncbi:MAG: chromosomal replication initiator protein DnaA [Clostridiales bacterium]|jgi:chromosomal replication initiator protein|nr:chromosomal replication initiator protein DnaA [Clostridiales bacterium]